MSKKNKVPKRINPSSFYKRVVYTFITFTFILILAILYFSFISATIIIIPDTETVSVDYKINVKDGGFSEVLVDDNLNGQFFEKEIEDELTFEATGEEKISSDTIGQVIIYNNRNVSQVLAATTQLQNAEGIIVRTKEKTVIPAQGRILVEVYPKDPKQIVDNKIEPSKFTVIKLPPYLQEKVYAENKETLRLGERTVKVVSKEDLENAEKKAIAKLSQEVFNEFRSQITLDKNDLLEVNDLKVLNQEFDVKESDQVDVFTLKIKVKIVGIVFSKKQLKEMSEKRLRLSLSSDRELFSLNWDTLSYELEKYDISQKIAHLKVYLEGQATLRSGSELLDKEKIKGLTKQEAIDYLSSFNTIKEVEIEFFPFWIKKIPTMTDHIEVMVKR